MATFAPKPLGRAARRPPLWASREVFFSDLGLYLLGVAGIFSLNLVGSLPGDEILIFPMLPVLLLAKGGRAFKRQYFWFYVLALAWLIGTIIGDAYNGVALPQRLKGMARVVFFALDFMALATLINNKRRRIVIFGASIVTVMLYIAHYFQGNFLVQWKFGLASSLIMAGLLVASYFYKRRRYWVCYGISVALAAINLKFAFRSQIAIILISAALTLPIFEGSKLERGTGRPHRYLTKLGLLLALAMGAIYLVNATIKFAAEHGFFEEGITDKFQGQSQGKLGVLVGGRPETLVAIQAIIDRPIIGHGSYAIDQHYIDLEKDIQYENGYTENDDSPDEENLGIPTHSHLTAGWVESGILGGLIWIYILIVTLKAICQIPILRPGLAPFYCYLLVNFLWDILYSPFGSINRLWGAYVLLVAYGVLEASGAGRRIKASNTRRPFLIRRMHRGREVIYQPLAEPTI